MMMGYGSGWGYDMMGGGWFVSLFMLFFGLLVLAGLVLLVVWAVRASGGSGSSGGTGSSHASTGTDEAIATVRRRFASGEITKEQYDEMIRLLSS